MNKKRQMGKGEEGARSEAAFEEPREHQSPKLGP